MVVSAVDKSLFEKLPNSTKKSKCSSLNTASEAEDITLELEDITLELEDFSLLLEDITLLLEDAGITMREPKEE